MSDAIPRALSLVRFTKEFSDFMEDYYKRNPNKDNQFTGDEQFIFLGEIPNMPEHCVIINVATRETTIGHHIENFIELTSEEV